MNEDYQEVYFDQYCKTCTHEKLEEKFDPCNECLDQEANLNSHRPVKWEENEK